MRKVFKIIILMQVLVILYLVSNEDHPGIKKMVSEQLLIAQTVYAQEKDVQDNNNNSDDEYDYTGDEQNEKIEWRESEIESKTENNISCWVGWKEYHYGAVTAISKKGDRVKFVQSPYIDINGDYHEGGEKEVETSGYGYYSLDYIKQLPALLSYMRNTKIGNYKVPFIPEDNILYDIEEEDNNEISIKQALEIVIKNMISRRNDGKYEGGEFKTFWELVFKEEYEKELRELQNKFYWKAYGESAYNVLGIMMNKKNEELSKVKQAMLRGVVLSVMEARYRNKDVQGKMDLKIDAAEGELWPFLVYLENLDKIYYDETSKQYIDSDKKRTYYKWPSLEKMIEGVYQWMVYSDADIIRTTSHSTITSIKKESEEEGEEIDVDWEGEYMELTGKEIPMLSGRALEEFYEKCQKVRSLFKKSKNNLEGIFGAQELYDITSDINFSTAMKNMKDAMEDFCGDGTMDSVWTGLTNYNIERTYLMAKNIVETNRVQDEFAYYDIGTNIITHTYGREGREYMLMDFQIVKLKEPLKDKYDNWTNIDTDGDGILDRNELGDNPNSNNDKNKEEEYSALYEKVDVTGFIKKTIQKELYGANDTLANEPESIKIVNDTLAKVKFNIYKAREEFIKMHEEDNVCNRREDKEHYLNIDSATETKLKNKTDADRMQILSNGNEGKLQVSLYKYTSNPVLKDTDFDGISDKEDKAPKNNHFTGRMHTTRLSGSNAIEVDMNMDYRYFFMSNKLYYDELSTMSLLYANSIYRRGKDKHGTWLPQHSGLQLRSANNFAGGIKLYTEEGLQNMDIDEFNNLQVKGLMTHFGFDDVKTYYVGEQGDGTDLDPSDGSDNCMGRKDTHKGRLALGYKKIEYHGLLKTVIGVVIRGTAEDDDWDSDFDMGDIRIKKLKKDGQLNNKNLSELGYDTKYRNELNHFIDGYDDWECDYHHAGFDIISNRLLDAIDEYINNIPKDSQGEICYWITGHSMGAGVANIIAAKLIDKGYKDNVYCYTFAAPNTFYRTDNKDDYREPHGVKYRCIFNIVNDDDFVPKLPMEECGWTRYGRVAGNSFRNKFWNNQSKFNISITLGPNYRPFINGNYNLYKFASEYRGNPNNPVAISKSFSSIFNNKNEMRKETYDQKEENFIVIPGNKNLDRFLFRYTLPYQRNKFKEKYIIHKNNVKIDKNKANSSYGQDGSILKNVYSQEMYPQYFFLSIASMMHEYPDYEDDIDDRQERNADDNKIKFFMLGLPPKYDKARKSFFSFIPLNFRVLYLEHPHYLESYYSLTKITSNVDFK